MTAPLVSIVVAAHCSQAEHFSTALRSALAQSWPQLEVLIGDDSPDERLRSLVDALLDTRLHYQHHVPALGVARNHWALFARARGEYIVVLNHDDWLAPDFVATMVDALQRQPRAVLAFCDHWVIDAAGRRQQAETDHNSVVWGRAGLASGLHQPLMGLLAAQTIPMAMGTLFRRSALPTQLPAHAGPAYDLWLTYLLARGGRGACYEPRRLSAWRSHAGNLTSGAGLPWLQGAAECWQAIAADREFADIRAAALDKAAASHCACAVRSWRDGHRIACMRFALHSLRAGFSARGLVALLMLPLLPRAALQWRQAMRSTARA